MANKPQGFVEIPGWGNKYLINKYADVFNTDRGILMKPHLAKHGYYMITLCDKGRRKTYLLHRLVAMTFIRNPKGYPQVNHKDENRINNNVDNLEWCTNRYNSNYGDKRKRLSEHHSLAGANATKRPVIQCDMDGRIIASYESQTEASKRTKVNNGSIALCCKGIYKSAGGFIWKFKED